VSTVSKGMGAAGKKLDGGGARSRARSPTASVSDGGYGARPHPARIRAGQKFWPRSGRRRRAFVVCKVGLGGVVYGRPVDGASEHVRTTAARLAATRSDGQGRYYSFLAWAPRRYRTWAVVMRIEEARALLVLPEWHPGRPVPFPARLLPRDARRAGVWLTVRVDLSVPAAGQLNLSDLSSCPDPGIVRCPKPIWEPAW
jgi:hypothetical protein